MNVASCDKPFLNISMTLNLAVKATQSYVGGWGKILNPIVSKVVLFVKMKDLFVKKQPFLLKRVYLICIYSIYMYICYGKTKTPTNMEKYKKLITKKQ